jgi:hypothetical protein
MMQVFYIFNSNRKIKLEFILNETKNIKHQPLVFFSLKLVIAGFKDYQIKYTILVLKPKQIKQQQMEIKKVMKDFNLYNKSRKINNIKINNWFAMANQTKLNQTK